MIGRYGVSPAPTNLSRFMPAHLLTAVALPYHITARCTSPSHAIEDSSVDCLPKKCETRNRGSWWTDTNLSIPIQLRVQKQPERRRCRHPSPSFLVMKELPYFVGMFNRLYDKWPYPKRLFSSFPNPKIFISRCWRSEVAVSTVWVRCSF